MVKRARMSFQTVLSVVLGALCFYCAANVGFATENAAENARVTGRWNWLDSRSDAAPSLSPDALPWFAAPTKRPPTCSSPRPSWFDALELAETAELTPCHDYVLSTFAATSELIRIQTKADDAPEEIVTIYRGANISNLSIAPFGKRVFAYACGGWGEQSEQNADADKPGFSVGSWGGGLGQDWNLFGHGIVGYGLQGNETKLKPKARGVYQSSMSTFAGYLHMSIFDALWRFDTTFGMSRNWQRQRLLSGDSFNSFTTSQWLLDLEFGARYDRGYTRIEPFINGRILNLTEPSKAEKYLTTKSYTADYSDASYRLKLGSRFSWEHETILATLKPYLLAAWAHEFGDREIYTIGDSSPFPVAMRYGTHAMARDRLDLGGGVSAAMRETLDLYFQYDVEFATDYVDYLFFDKKKKKF